MALWPRGYNRLLTICMFVTYRCRMSDTSSGPLYQAFGDLVQMHRKRTQGMTQQKLGNLVGLSRTSITNIEKGRQHVSLHHLYAIAGALEVSPEALLPSFSASEEHSSIMDKLPPGTDPKVREWAGKLIRQR